MRIADGSICDRQIALVPYSCSQHQIAPSAEGVESARALFGGVEVSQCPLYQCVDGVFKFRCHLQTKPPSLDKTIPVSEDLFREALELDGMGQGFCERGIRLYEEAAQVMRGRTTINAYQRAVVTDSPRMASSAMTLMNSPSAAISLARPIGKRSGLFMVLESGIKP